MTDISTLHTRLRELLAKATPGPWGWANFGEKSNNAVLGVWFNKGGEQIPGNVEEEVYDEHTGDYKRVADFDEAIAIKDDNARYTDFALICELRNHAELLCAALECVEAADRLLVLDEEWMAKQECPTAPLYQLNTQATVADDNNYRDARARLRTLELGEQR